MKFQDYYQTLGLARDARPEDVKKAYRKLARKYHPDVSAEPDAEARFKEINEANEVLKDPEKRAAYDAVGSQWREAQNQAQAQQQAREAGRAAPGGQADFQPPPGWDAGFEFSGRGGEAGDPFGGFGDFSDGDHSDFFEALFGRAARSARAGRADHPQAQMRMPGQDHHAKVMIDLEDAYRGSRRSISLRIPVIDDEGHGVLQERTLEVNIPKGLREGQHLRLAGQGGPGLNGGAAGDLFLEIAFNPHRLYRVDGRDVFVDLPLAPWEAALGAAVSTPTPEGEVELTIPPGSAAGRKLRLKGRGLLGEPAGDLYVVLAIALPTATDAAARKAYQDFAAVFATGSSGFDPRAGLKG